MPGLLCWIIAEEGEEEEEDQGASSFLVLLGMKVIAVVAIVVVVIASQKKSPQSGSWSQSLRGNGSALESHSLGLAFPVRNLKLGLRELNSS